VGRLVVLDVIEVEVLVDADMPDDDAEAVRRQVRAEVGRALSEHGHVHAISGVTIRVR
jgi:hypothetical protein